MTDAKSSCCAAEIPAHHMCQLTQPANEFDLQAVLAVASNPQFLCRCCGRMANRERNVCTPVNIKYERTASEK